MVSPPGGAGNCEASPGRRTRSRWLRMKPTILIVDDEPGVRSALAGVLSDEGYEVEAVASGEACLERLTRGSGRPDCPRRLAARDGRPRDAGAAARAAGGCADRADFRPRQHRVGRARHQARRLRLRREAAVARQDGPRRPERLAPAPPRSGEPRAARARGPQSDDGGGELRDAAAPRAGRHGGADQRPRAHLRRERDRQGAGRAHDSRAEPPPAAAPSSRSTAPRFPRS